MDKLEAIKSFIEVANCRSFTQAAEVLNLSRLQVSRHIQEMEAWLQQRLLHRTTRKVSLTDAGEQAYVRCQRILDEAAALQVEALSRAQALSGLIRVSAPIGFSQHLLIDAVCAFTQLHPQVTVDILASDKFSQLVDERVDVALRYTNQPDESLIAKKLMAIDTVICASEEYLRRHSPIEQPQRSAPAQLFGASEFGAVAFCCGQPSNGSGGEGQHSCQRYGHFAWRGEGGAWDYSLAL